MSKPNGKPAVLGDVFDSDAERVILAQVLISGGAAMDGLRSTMDPEDFGFERNRRIWKVACDLYDESGKLDQLTVGIELIRRGQAGQDEASYLHSLQEGIPLYPALDQHIAALKDRALLRKIASMAQNLQMRATSGMEKGEELREAMGAYLTNLSDIATAEKKPVSSREMMEKTGVDELLDPRRKESVRLPWGRLNTALGGFRAGQNIIIAADTGRGKTSAACQIAVHCLRQGKGVLYWTMEMPPEALFCRMVTQMTGVDRKSGAPTFEQREREREAVALLYETPIYFDNHSRTVAGFCSSIRQVRRKTRLGLVVVDYLQLIRSAGKAESRTREVGENSRALKLATMDFELPFLVLSQFSRPKEGARPTIHSLKESGDCENDADVILLFISGEMSRDQPTPVAVNIGKQREGVAGFDVPLIFYPQSQRFESAEE